MSVRVTDYIDTTAPTDTYPTHLAAKGKGGFMSVGSISERDNIPSARLEVGMWVNVTGDNVYEWNGLSWGMVTGLAGSGGNNLFTTDLVQTEDRIHDCGDNIFRFNNSRVYFVVPNQNHGLAVTSGLLSLGSFDGSGASVVTNITGDYATVRGDVINFFSTDAGKPPLFKLWDGSGTDENYIAFRSPSGTLLANYTYTLPANYGVNGQVLASNGSGNLTWKSFDAASELLVTGHYYYGKTIDGFSSTSDSFFSSAYFSEEDPFGLSDGTGIISIQKTGRYSINVQGSMDDTSNTGSVELRVDGNTVARTTVRDIGGSVIGLPFGLVYDGQLSPGNEITLYHDNSGLYNDVMISLRENIDITTFYGTITGTPVTILDDGSIITSDVSAINFIGDQFQITNTGGSVAISLNVTDTNTNMANTDLVFSANRSHNASGYDFAITGSDAISLLGAGNSGIVSDANGIILSNSSKVISKSPVLYINSPDGTTQARLAISDLTDIYQVSLRAPSSLTTSTVYTLPTGYGISGQILASDSAGNLYWETNTSGNAENLFTTDLTLTADRSHDLGGNMLLMSNADNVIISNSNIMGLGIQTGAQVLGSLASYPAFIVHADTTGTTSASKYFEISNGDNPANLFIMSNATGNYVGFTVPTGVASNLLYVLPGEDGSNGQSLTTNGAGVLSWASISGGTTINSGTLSGRETVTSVDNLGYVNNYKPINIDYAVNLVGSGNIVSNTVNQPTGGNFDTNDIIIEMTTRIVETPSGKYLTELIETDTTRYALDITSGNLYLYDGNVYANIGAAPSDNEWHDIKVTLDNGTVTYFLDGSGVSSNSYTAFSWGASNTIDISVGGSTSGQNIAAEFANYKVSDTSSTILEYNFDEGTGINVNDISVNGRDGVIINPLTNDLWLSYIARSTANEVIDTITGHQVISTGVHIVDANLIDISGNQKIDGNYKWDTVLYNDRTYNDRLPVLDLPLNIAVASTGGPVSVAYDHSENALHGAGSGFSVPDKNSNDGPISTLGRYTSFSTYGIDVPHNALLSTGSAESFTVEFWMRTANGYSPGSSTGLISKFQSGLNREFDINILSGFFMNFTVRFETSPFSKVSNPGSLGLNDGNWHHVVITVKSPYVKWYVDGVNTTTHNIGDFVITSNTHALNIGHKDGSSARFVGDLAGVKFYRVRLTDKEVEQKYRYGRPSILQTSDFEILNKTDNKWIEEGVPGKVGIQNMTIYGKGNNTNDYSLNQGKPYLLNGANLFAIGYDVRNIDLYNIQGAAIYSDIGTGSMTGNYLISDSNIATIDNVNTSLCYAGISIDNIDDITVSNFQSINARDFGIDIRNGKSAFITDANIYGGAVGVRVGTDSSYISKMKVEDANCGLLAENEITVDNYIAKDCKFFAIDCLDSIQCSMAKITIPTGTSINTGIFNKDYIVTDMYDYSIPQNYYSDFNEVGAPVGIRLQNNCIGASFDNVILDGTQTGIGINNVGFELRGSQNYIKGRANNLGIVGYINGITHDNEINLIIDGCQSGIVVTDNSDSALGCDITIKYKNIPGGSGNAFVDQSTSGVFTTNNTITLIALN